MLLWCGCHILVTLAFVSLVVSSRSPPLTREMVKNGFHRYYWYSNKIVTMTSCIPKINTPLANKISYIQTLKIKIIKGNLTISRSHLLVQIF